MLGHDAQAKAPPPDTRPTRADVKQRAAEWVERVLIPAINAQVCPYWRWRCAGTHRRRTCVHCRSWSLHCNPVSSGLPPAILSLHRIEPAHAQRETPPPPRARAHACRQVIAHVHSRGHFDAGRPLWDPRVGLVRTGAAPGMQGDNGWDILRALSLVRERCRPASIDAAAADAIEKRCLTVRGALSRRGVDQRMSGSSSNPASGRLLRLAGSPQLE